MSSGRPTMGVMRGDRVEVTVDIGTGVKVYDVVATRAGRRVEVNAGRTIGEVTEVTRSGTPVRTARFLAARVVALVEHPSGQTPTETPVSCRPRLVSVDILDPLAGTRVHIPEHAQSLPRNLGKI